MWLFIGPFTLAAYLSYEWRYRESSCLRQVKGNQGSLMNSRLLELEQDLLGDYLLKRMNIQYIV